MNLRGRWLPGSWTSKRQPARGGDGHFEAAPVPGLDDLQTRLNQWSNLWSQDTDAGIHTAAQELVAERLTHWMERCFGRHVESSMRGKGHSISLASSTPIFTAFLGRRATRELSRRVLQDI
ncbi:MAG: hypothetical protein ABR923_06355 [Terracidiphilus sp.]